MPQTLSADSIYVLKHLRTHGITTLKDMKTFRADLKQKTLDNLRHRGSVVRHEAGFAITPEGRAKLASCEGVFVREAAAAPAEPQIMLSAQQVETAIAAVLERARARISLQDVCRRTHLAESIIRPAITIMVQAGRVNVTSGKPPLYHLAVQALQKAHPGRGPADYPSGYTCPELARNPGIQPERFAAFALPSRMGDRLHYPDGRVEPFPNMREVVAA